MNVEPKCCSCKRLIRNDNVLYMCVDNTFCSMSCRDKHLKYIRNFDPEFNYPEKWNNNNLSAKIDCLIEVDYLHFPRMNSKHKLYRSNSLTNLLEYKEKEKVFITCIKFYTFSLKIKDKKIKILALCLIIVLISIAIRTILYSN